MQESLPAYQKDLAVILEHIDRRDSFVLNIVADWCTDCTERQAPLMAGFVERLNDESILTVQLLAQHEKNEYLSPEHCSFVAKLGGHGFPRTVAFINGIADSESYVEVVEEHTMKKLADKFIQKLRAN
ncbi:hypothetical protein EDC56_2541 [Sinobacterium caligoides]|uniref:Thioredoxin n=2 Tax=Sinobacterium caligoides TaxID=933926 RepID=A0A3N2DJE5_9GAMM|nr:hypothetical protein EDC56_2541 [Sinobacterium caligoides]